MKKLLTTLFATVLVFITTLSFAQNPIKFRLSASVATDAPDTVKTNTNGTLLHKGDQFVVYLSANGNGNTTTRQLLLDFQYDNSALTLTSIANTGTGGNGGVLPQGSNAQESFYQYPGYSFHKTTQNTTSNGTTNYQYCNYDYTSGGSSTIVRYNLTWSGTRGMPYANYWGLIKMVFTVKQTMTGYLMNPIQLNFVSAWTGTGSLDATTQENPLTIKPYLNPNADSYVNATIDINANMTAISPMKVLFQDTTTKMSHLYDITSNGQVNVNQPDLSPNTVYRVMGMVNMDKLYNVYNAAVTVSDFTGPQNEFVSANLDGTPSYSVMTTGPSFLAADMNNDKVFNGSDLPILLAAAIAQDTLVKLPPGYTPGTNGYMSVWTFTDTVFNNMTTSSWKTLDLTKPVYFKTGNVGDYLPLNLKYLLWGDVNRSHSSQVIINGSPVSSALPSLQKSGQLSTFAVGSNAILLNTTRDIPSIDVNLVNNTVTSNTISIPVSVDTKGLSLSALQFEFEYDPAKISFDQLSLGLPNTWYSFVSSKAGKVKFGALDKSLITAPLTGVATPFTLKFSTIGDGVDILTSIKVTATMDASDTKGNQVGINLNTTTIKLTGYNNF